MDSVSLRGLTESKASMGYRSWYYDFVELPRLFDEDSIQRVGSSLSTRYAGLTRAWTPELNSEWAVRHYFAAKLIMAATIALNSLEFAEGHNLRLVAPYLRYYAVLYALRAVVLTIPESQWNDGALLQISHATAINSGANHVCSFDRAVGKQLELDVRRLKAERELISYRAPSEGDWNTLAESERAIEMCRLLAEIAQFDSELLEASVDKKADASMFVLQASVLEPVRTVEIDGMVFKDYEDAYRLDYLSRKHPWPANLRHTITEGHVDDFFGAWLSDSDEPGMFNPDESIRLIFSWV